MNLTEQLEAALRRCLAETTGSEVGIAGLRLMPGGASQETWRLDLTVKDGAWAGAHPLVVRRPAAAKIYDDALDPEPEFRVLRAAFESGVPIPRPYWFLPDVLGRPALVMQRLEGETIGRRIVKEPELAAARAVLPAQMGAALAAIHRVDLDRFALRGILPAPAPGETPALQAIRQGEADLDRLGEPHPAIELALRWLLRREPPPPARLVLVHGDFRIGNMMITPAGLSGVLDWEFAHLGDPAQDVAWGMVRDWRFGRDELRYGGLADAEPLLAAYNASSGPALDPARLLYWEIMGNVRWAIGTLNQAARHLSGREQNLELASLGRRCAEMELEALRLIRAAG